MSEVCARAGATKLGGVDRAVTPNSPKDSSKEEAVSLRRLCRKPIKQSRETSLKAKQWHYPDISQVLYLMQDPVMLGIPYLDTGVRALRMQLAIAWELGSF